MDFEDDIHNFYLMNDGNILIHRQDNKIKVIKIKRNDIEEISIFEKEIKEIKFCNNDILLFDVIIGKKQINGSFFRGITTYICEQELYTYIDKFIILKNISKIYKEENIMSVCCINKKELAFYTQQEIASDNIDNFIIFYDIENDKKIMTLKVDRKK